MAFSKLSPEALRAEVLKKYFQQLTIGDEINQALLIQGMRGAGVVKVEGVAGDSTLEQLVESTEDVLIALLQSGDSKEKSLGVNLAFNFYEGVRSARFAAIENSATSE